MNILYCFISHQPVVVEDSVRISNMMKKLNYNNYIIVCGGNGPVSIDNPYVVFLECPDDYCSLPEKINKAFKYAYSNIQFDFLVKFDRTIEVLKIFDTQTFCDYNGIELRFQEPKFHFGRCTKNSQWHNKIFNFEPILYAGGIGYILSKKAAKYIAQDDSKYLNHIYEDLYVGSIMKNNSILVENFKFDYRDYFFDPSHSAYFL